MLCQTFVTEKKGNLLIIAAAYSHDKKPRSVDNSHLTLDSRHRRGVSMSAAKVANAFSLLDTSLTEDGDYKPNGAAEDARTNVKIDARARRGHQQQPIKVISSPISNPRTHPPSVTSRPTITQHTPPSPACNEISTIKGLKALSLTRIFWMTERRPAWISLPRTTGCKGCRRSSSTSHRGKERGFSRR